MTSTTKKLILAASILAATVATAQVYKGLRVPQLSTTDRASIGAEAAGTTAAGQQVFNLTTGQMEYFDGTKWVGLQTTVKDKDSIVGNEVTGASDATLTRSGAGTTASPYLLKANPTVIADSIAKNLTNTVLGDTILNYITNNLSQTNLGDTILQYITNNFTNELGDTILNYITNNVTQELTDSIMSNVSVSGTRGIVISGSGTSAIDVALPAASASNDVLTWNAATQKWEAKGIGTITTSGTVTSVTTGITGLTFGVNTTTTPQLAIAGTPTAQQFLAGDGTWKTIVVPLEKDSVIGNEFSDTIPNRGGLTKSGAGTAADPLKVGLVAGTAADQILKWNAGTSRWELATAQSVIKKLTITPTTTAYTTNSVQFFGTTGTSANAIEVVGIEPIISSTTPNDKFINDNLIISTTAKVKGNAIVYTVVIKNANIDTAKGFTVEGINIFYTCTDTLTGAAPAEDEFVGQ
ncbi:MAG: hypothetical protein LBN27_06445 [Prevotellaceae bacterium]|jgi:hypothetical protein|nr:hypothetical protein [Prevotellaceae bacterium]